MDISRKRTEIISPDAREKERLIVARMSMSGRHTLADMAAVAGRSRSTIQIWLEMLLLAGKVAGVSEGTPSRAREAGRRSRP